jgi:hypothetical protein
MVVLLSEGDGAVEEADKTGLFGGTFNKGIYY